MHKLIVILLAMGLLGGCQNMMNPVKNRDKEYLESQTAPVASVPAGLDDTHLGSDYVVPIDSHTEPVAQPDLMPPHWQEGQ